MIGIVDTCEHINYCDAVIFNIIISEICGRQTMVQNY